MASVIDICNSALDAIGAETIMSLNEDSIEARKCNEYYDTVRRAMLEERSWNFATVVKALAKIDQESIQYSNVYAYPADCVDLLSVIPNVDISSGSSNVVDVDGQVDDSWYQSRGLINTFSSGARTQKNIPYRISSLPSLDGKVILTDLPQAIGVYTADVKNVNQFSAIFREALAYRLASKIVMPLTRDKALQQQLIQQAESLMAKASSNNLGEARADARIDSEFVRVRN